MEVLVEGVGNGVWVDGKKEFSGVGGVFEELERWGLGGEFGWVLVGVELGWIVEGVWVEEGWGVGLMEGEKGGEVLDREDLREIGKGWWGGWD